ncbi:hypothetical protein FQR65_LT20713 [Abscondita terminalis]|nr:hypothetical protein FQR65_LT20713 [Abscondita terminalis]
MIEEPGGGNQGDFVDTGLCRRVARSRCVHREKYLGRNRCHACRKEAQAHLPPRPTTAWQPHFAPTEMLAPSTISSHGLPSHSSARPEQRLRRVVYHHNDARSTIHGKAIPTFSTPEHALRGRASAVQSLERTHLERGARANRCREHTAKREESVRRTRWPACEHRPAAVRCATDEPPSLKRHRPRPRQTTLTPKTGWQLRDPLRPLSEATSAKRAAFVCSPGRG